MLQDGVLGFIGAGNMGEALIKGILGSKRLKPSNIIACDKDKKRSSHIAGSYGIEVYSSPSETVNKADIVLLAVKPQNIDEVIDEIRDSIDKETPIISIAAGVSLEHIRLRLNKSSPLIRVMPNTPALVQEGMSAICPGRGVSEGLLKYVTDLFESIGRVVVIEDERLMDAVTGLSGSGPAFVFMFLEALADGGVKMGLKRDVAELLATQTVLGSARLAIETGRHFGQLKDMVASPGGTTIAGISTLEKRGFRGIVIDAIEDATLKSIDLSRKGG